MKDFLERLASDSPTPGGGSASATSGAMGAALLSMVFLISRKKILKTLEKQRKEILNALKIKGENKAQILEEEERVQEFKNFYKEGKTKKILIEKFKKSADEAKKAMNELLLLIDEDAKSYENVLIKLRKLRNLKTAESKAEIDSSKVKINDSKEKKSSSEVEIDIIRAKEDLQKAYKHATEVPLQIAVLCYKILKTSDNLSRNIAPSVKSDFQIAILLLKTGIKGASLNVEVNVNEVYDESYVMEKRKALNKILKYLN
ncbi:hypothetical protein ES703_79934 [subsurface metagenome]